MSDGANQTNVSDNAIRNIGDNGIAFVPVEVNTIAPAPNDVHPVAVITTTDATPVAQPADFHPIDGLEITQISTMQSLEQLDDFSTNMNVEDIQNYDRSLEMLEDEENKSKVPADKSKLPLDNRKQKQVLP